MRHVSVYQKVHFIKWFTKTYELKQIETKWLLDYIAAYPELVRKIHFVSNAQLYKESIVISAKSTDTPSFRHKNGTAYSHDIEAYYLSIRKDTFDELHIELVYPGSKKCQRYISVLEENPELSSLSFFDRQDIDHLIHAVAIRHKEDWLMQEIDKSLDLRDAESFRRLSMELIALRRTQSAN